MTESNSSILEDKWLPRFILTTCHSRLSVGGTAPAAHFCGPVLSTSSDLFMDAAGESSGSKWNSVIRMWSDIRIILTWIIQLFFYEKRVWVASFAIHRHEFPRCMEANEVEVESCITEEPSVCKVYLPRHWVRTHLKRFIVSSNNSSYWYLCNWLPLWNHTSCCCSEIWRTSQVLLSVLLRPEFYLEIGEYYL